MRKNGRKKGSSFVMVVIMTAIIFTTATTMIALVTTDYRNRITQSRRLENLYGSDADMDIAYNIIVKNCDAAVVYANHKAKEYEDSISGSERIVSDSYDVIYRDINKVYQKSFISFLDNIRESDADNNINNIDSTMALSKDNQKLIYGVMRKTYVVPSQEGTALGQVTHALLSDKNNSTAYSWLADNAIAGTEGAKQNADFRIVSYQMDSTNNSITLEICSTFTSENNNDDMENKRSISLKYRINAPKYNQKVGTKAENITTFVYPTERAIVTDGNLDLSGGDTTVSGDIWVKGDATGYSTSDAYSYDKYNSGIYVKDGSTLNVPLGNVFTASTFNVQNHSRVTIANNVYALNAYVGPSEKKAVEVNATDNKNNKLTINGDLVTNNDLTLNSSNSDVLINNFYGINDTTCPENFVTADSGETASRNSSSVIVNNYKDSTLTIQNYAYIMGLAYIEMGTSYKTGESVGVKGNYVAYSDVLPNGEQVTLRNYNPLTLVDEKVIADSNGDKTVDKAKYFIDYFSKHATDIKRGGISLDSSKLYTLGAYVDNDEYGSKGNGVTPEVANEKINSLKQAFATQVFAMGVEMNDPKLYTKNSVVKTVDNQIDWNSHGDFIPGTTKGTSLSEAFGKFILNTDKKKDITITKNGIQYDGKNIDAKISSLSDGYQYALIITKGKVNIVGDVKFKGSIIAVGDISISGSGTKDIQYDRQKVAEIKAKYRDEILINGSDNLFVGGPLPLSQAVVSVETSLVSDTVTGEKFDATNYLQKGPWKLQK